MKKFNKFSIVLLITLALAALISVCAFAATAEEGLSFSLEGDADKWHLRKPLADAPYSFEMWIKVAKDAEDGRLGIIFSNYDGGSGTSTYYGNSSYTNRTIDLEIHKNGVPRLYYGIDTDGDGTLGRVDTLFSDVDVRTGEWLHLAIVKEPSDMVCYVNGVEAQRIADSAVYHSDNLLQPFALGGENRSGNTYYFQGSIKGFTAYRDFRTAGEIKSSYEYGVKTSDENMILHYDLTTPPLGDYIEDLSGNGYYAAKSTYVSSVESENNVTIGDKGTGSLGSGAVDDSAPDYDYSFAVVGDTQYITKWDVYDGTNYLGDVYDWIIRNKDIKNIKYVMGLGDITDIKTGNADEWTHAKTQISKLNGVIPYSLVRGNHDEPTLFNSTFNNDEYKNQVTGGFYTDDSGVDWGIRNGYSMFEVGSEKYLLFMLDDNPTDAVLTWADELIAKNTDRKVIITTHTYLGYTGDLIDDSSTYSYATKDVEEGENNGKQIWDKLVKKRENIVLVLCGHDYKAYDIVWNERYGEAGNAVTELLICPQSRDGNESSSEKNKQGMVAMLYFSNDGKDVRVEWVSTVDSEATSENDDEKTDVIVANNSFGFMIAGTPTNSKYGLIPEYYSDAAKWPLALFSNGDHIGSYNDWATALKAVNPKLAGLETSARQVELLLLSDFTAGVYDNTSQFGGTFVIDLNHKTLNSGGTGSGKEALSGTAKTSGDTNIVFKDGYISIYKNQVSNFAVWSEKLTTAGKKVTYTFDNVNFGFASQTKTNILVAGSKNNGTTDNDAIKNVKVYMIFNNCVFDLVTDAPDGATLFNFDDTMSTVDANVVINGGIIKRNAHTGQDTLYSIGNEDAVSYGKYEGSYTKLYLPTGVAPTKEYLTSATEGVGEVVFVLAEDKGTNAIYNLIPKAIAEPEFIPNASVSLHSNLIFNIYLPDVSIIDSVILAGKTVNLGEEKDGYYKISTPLAASESAGELELIVVLELDGFSTTGTFTFSTVKYAKKIIEGDYTDVEKTLAKDMLAYIRSAYVYLAGATDETAEVVAIDAVLGSYEREVSKLEGIEVNTAAGLKGATFNLEATPKVRFILPEGANPGAYTFKIGETTLSYTTGKVTIDSKEYDYCEIELYACELMDVITYTDGENSGSYHINSYYDYVVGTGEGSYAEADKATLAILTAKLYNYCQSAAAYRDAVSQGN